MKRKLIYDKTLNNKKIYYTNSRFRVSKVVKSVFVSSVTPLHLTLFSGYFADDKTMTFKLSKIFIQDKSSSMSFLKFSILNFS